MRTLFVLLLAAALVFTAAMGFFWWRTGSIEGAGAWMDGALAEVDRETQPLQEEVADLGDATAETLENLARDE
jgi:hypothetical protein